MSEYGNEFKREDDNDESMSNKDDNDKPMSNNHEEPVIKEDNVELKVEDKNDLPEENLEKEKELGSYIDRCYLGPPGMPRFIEDPTISIPPLTDFRGNGKSETTILQWTSKDSGSLKENDDKTEEGREVGENTEDNDKEKEDKEFKDILDNETKEEKENEFEGVLDTKTDEEMVNEFDGILDPEKKELKETNEFDGIIDSEITDRNGIQKEIDRFDQKNKNINGMKEENDFDKNPIDIEKKKIEDLSEKNTKEIAYDKIDEFTKAEDKEKNLKDEQNQEDSIKDSKKELFESLKNIFSKEFGGKKLTNTKFGELINYEFRKSINNNRKIRVSSFGRIENEIKYNLTGENRENALRALEDFKKNRGIVFTEGRRHTPESKRKISESNKGRKYTPESRKKMSESHKGVPLSETHRKAMSEAQKDNKNPFYGKKHSPESKKKMSEAQKGNKHHNYGKELPLKTRKKISESLKGPKHYRYNPNRGEVYDDYGGVWRDLKEEHITYLMGEQGGRDALTGVKFKPNQLIHRHHINYNKEDSRLDNLCLLTAGSHAKVSNSILKNELFKMKFQEGKKALKEGKPPKYWSDLNRRLFLREKKNNPK